MSQTDHTRDHPDGTHPSAGAAAAGQPNRLLAASRVVHQLWRTQDRKVDLNRLLADELYAKNLLKAAKVHADAKTSEFIDAFERACLAAGIWSSAEVPPKPTYQANADGSVSAAAAWDPDYTPPASIDEVKPETEYIPTTSPRTSMLVKEQGNSGFASRFGFSRPAGRGEADVKRANSSSSVPPNSNAAGSSSPSPQSEPAPGPIDPNNKKYIRGAR